MQNTTHLKSFILYEIALNKFFCSPLKRLIVSSVHAMTQSKKAKQYDTKHGARKGLILNYDDLIEQGWNRNSIKATLKELVNDGYLEKIAIRGNRQLMCIKEKAIKILKKFSDMFSRDEQEGDNSNFGSQIINEPLVQKSSNPYKGKIAKLKNNILKNHEHQNNHETKPEDKEECFDCSLLDELYGNDESLKIENVLNQQESEISNPTLTESTTNSNDESLNVIDLEYDSALDINNAEQEETTSYIKEKLVEDIQGGFDGSYDQIKEIEKLNDDFTTKQIEAINYFATEHNLDIKFLEEMCSEKLLIENFNTFQELVLSSISELEKIKPRISNECDLNAVGLSEISKKPKKIDFYAVNKAESLRDGLLTEKQINGIHSILDFAERKLNAKFDYYDYFVSIYFQLANPDTDFKQCNFQKAIWIIAKLIKNGDYKTAYGSEKWIQENVA
jgi:hypothetical protein